MMSHYLSNIHERSLFTSRFHLYRNTKVSSRACVGSDSVMDCHVTTRGLNPGGNGLFTELHVLRKGQ